MYIRRKLALNVFSLLLLFFFASCDSDSVSNSGNGIDESQIAQNSIVPTLQNVVAFHLEDPRQGSMNGDTGTVGVDVIPYNFNFTGTQTVEFCFQSEKPDTLTLFNSQSAIVFQIQASSTCSNASISGGVYSFQFENAGTGVVKVSNFFIRQDPESTSYRLLINPDCQNCNLSGINMEYVDVIGRDFTGSSFENAQLSGNNFENTNLSGVSLKGANITDAGFSKLALSGNTVQKTWTSQDGTIGFQFTLPYNPQGQVPEVLVNPIQDGEVDPDQTPLSFRTANSLFIRSVGLYAQLRTVALNVGNGDAGIWGDVCWGQSLNQCFHGVMVSFDSNGYYSNSNSEFFIHDLSASSVVLNYVNASDIVENFTVVVFQKNLAGSTTAVAWRTLENVGQGDNHPFIYSNTYQIGASDSFGNLLGQLDAAPGQLFEVVSTLSGDTLQFLGESSQTRETQLINNLMVGSVGVLLYRDSLLLAEVNNVPPDQDAVFQMGTSLFFVVTSDVVQGESIPSSVISQSTELSLLGIASADIILTGGGNTPFQFNFQNVVFQ